MSRRDVAIDINGTVYERTIEPRMLLSDFIRHEANLTGTHVGCEHGVCGACTIQLDGEPVRSCIMFAVQADGRSIRTVEAMTEGLPEGDIHASADYRRKMVRVFVRRALEEASSRVGKGS